MCMLAHYASRLQVNFSIDVFGKRGRWFMHQHNVLEMAGLESKQVRG